MFQKILFFFTFLFLITTQVHTEENLTNDNSTIYNLDQFTVTANRIKQNLNTTPATVTVISSEKIEQNGFKTLGDALSNGALGVNINNYGGLSGKSIPYILGTDEILVLIDGKRMNLPQGVATGKGGVDLNTIPLSDNIAKIEIVTGGNSVMYGSDAVGGVINIITKKGSNNTPSSLLVAAGSNSAYNYKINLQGNDDLYNWFIGAQSYGDFGQRQNSASQNKNFSFRLDRKLTQDETLTLNFDMVTNHNDLPGPTISPTPNDYSNLLKHSWSLSYNRQHQEQNMMFRYYFNKQTESGYNLDFFNNQNTVSVFEYQDSIKTNINNLWTWGAENRQEAVQSTTEGNITHTAINNAFFLQNQLILNKKTTVVSGLRYDTNSIYGHNLSPKISLMYQAELQTLLYANWGTVFKAPNFDDLYSVTAYGNGNPNLKAETGWAAEVGLKKQLNPNTNALFSLFKRNMYNAIRWMPDNTGFFWQPQNITNLVSTGINFSFNHKFSKIWNIDLGYTYLDSINANTDAGIGDPHNSFFINLNYKSGKWQSTLNGTYTGPHDLGINAVSGYFITNFSTKYSIEENTDLMLQINNLFNRQYQPQNWYPAPGFTLNFSIKQYW